MLKIKDLENHPQGYAILLPQPFLDFAMSYQHVHKLIKILQHRVIGSYEGCKFFRKILGILPGFRKLTVALVQSLTKE